MLSAAIFSLVFAVPQPLIPELPTTLATSRPGLLLAVAADRSWAAFSASASIQVWNLRTGALDRVVRVPNTNYDHRTLVDPRGRWAAYVVGPAVWRLQLI